MENEIKLSQDIIHIANYLGSLKKVLYSTINSDKDVIMANQINYLVGVLSGMANKAEEMESSLYNKPEELDAKDN